MKKLWLLPAVIPSLMGVAAVLAGAAHGLVSADEPVTVSEPAPQSVAPVDPAALARARKQVQMLDTIYKQTIVLITDKYVHDKDDFAAGSAAVLLFQNISASGFHKVRLLDATGEPIEPENVARDDFEREGIRRLKAGAGTYDQVQQLDGRPHLRVLTPVPVVMKKCVMCHEHYAAAKSGEPIGAISYTLPLE